MKIAPKNEPVSVALQAVEVQVGEAQDVGYVKGLL